MSENSPRPTVEEIQHWMAAQFARRLQVPPESLRPEAPLDTLALDSVMTIEVLGEMEQWLGRRIDPEIVFECSTIGEFAERLGR